MIAATRLITSRFLATLQIGSKVLGKARGAGVFWRYAGGFFFLMTVNHVQFAGSGARNPISATSFPTLAFRLAPRQALWQCPAACRAGTARVGSSARLLFLGACYRRLVTIQAAVAQW
ncbi:hypothetical protein [Hyphomicrobium sp.]|uniref:hypothetical protein n=1 Tax=Hyphomicrobium sp. TaxID=82 RepID=UPI002C643844|nr:hypothetical protein [Hyphomicrobium sp.]HVZ04452.1 hypothetical protein [Hyphomicrobium sp.]